MQGVEPRDEQELLDRAQALAGLTLAQVAARVGRRPPRDLRRTKGWVGQLLESSLGATASTLAEPDFPHLGVELKTLPVDRRGLPKESTYVCTVPLTDNAGTTWENSWVRRKLARVLWMPVEADPAIALPARRVGSPLLWSPSAEEDELLRCDFEELMDMVCLGQIDQITARHGTVLQIRPKAANAAERCWAVGESGAPVLTQPRGFYLRASFTAAILRRHYVLPG